MNGMRNWKGGFNYVYKLVCCSI